MSVRLARSSSLKRRLVSLLGMSALVAGLSAASTAQAAPEESVLKARGVPEGLVRGRALVKIDALSAHNLRSARGQAAFLPLGKALAADGLALELVRPLVLGWGLFEIRALSPEQQAAWADDPQMPLDKLAVPSEAETEVLIAQLNAHEGIADASPDHWYRRYAVPNDPGMGQMWHLTDIGAAAAWDITTGSASQRVGVVDTGIVRAHQDLVAKDVAGYDFVSDVWGANDGSGRDADYDDPGDGADCGRGAEPDSFHGTHVSGTVLASTNNGMGIAGLNWHAQLVTGRAMGRCGGAESDIMEAAYWMAGGNVTGVPSVGANRVSVMNLSLGGANACSGFEQQVIDAINGAGVRFVAATGNDGGAVGSPASCTGVLSVAAHGPENTRNLTPYSSFGPEVEIVAPGGDQRYGGEYGVWSAMGPGVSDYAPQQGTSMAAPHVAGVVSLIQDLQPGISFADVTLLLQNTGEACEGCQGVPAMRADGALLAAQSGDWSNPVTPPGPEDDAFEENDSFAAAASVQCGQTIDAMAIAGDADWYTFTAPAGENVNVRLSGGSIDLDLYVYGTSEGQKLGESTSPTGTEAVAFERDGTVHVHVDPYDGAQGPYTLEFDCGDVGPSNPGGGTTTPGGPNTPGGSNTDRGPNTPANPVPFTSDEPTVTAQGCGQAATSTSMSLAGLAFAVLTLRRRRR